MFQTPLSFCHCHHAGPAPAGPPLYTPFYFFLHLVHLVCRVVVFSISDPDIYNSTSGLGKGRHMQPTFSLFSYFCVLSFLPNRLMTNWAAVPSNCLWCCALLYFSCSFCLPTTLCPIIINHTVPCHCWLPLTPHHCLKAACHHLTPLAVPSLCIVQDLLLHLLTCLESQLLVLKSYFRTHHYVTPT